MHDRKDKIYSFKLIEQMKKEIKNSQIVAFENTGPGLFHEEARKFKNIN